MDIHDLYAIFLRSFRVRRMRAFLATFRPTAATRILDVGGTAFNWRLVDVRARVTLLNRTVPSETRPPNCAPVEASGTALCFADGSFDVAFSNSVIEHLGSFENQRTFASELRRVGAGLWVQTPARGFFVEPHLLAPFIHYLPRRWQRRLVRHFTLWGLVAKPPPAAVDAFLAETRLLTYQEMRKLFPDCEIRRERFLFFTKSYVAVRRVPA